MDTTIIHERHAHPILLKLLYWFAAVAVIVIGISYSQTISEKITNRAAVGENASELNYRNSERTVSDPKLPGQ